MNFHKLAGAIVLGILCTAQPLSDPWTPQELLDPALLASQLKQGRKPAKIISVAFPVLFKQRHVTGAVFAGPGNRAEGIEALKKEVAGLKKDADIVLYCGCCPMAQCPNIRPAVRALKEMGYTKVRVLNIPTNMHTDWYTKKYPSEPPVSE